MFHQPGEDDRHCVYYQRECADGTISCQADVWSLGVIAYLLCARVPPWALKYPDAAMLHAMETMHFAKAAAPGEFPPQHFADLSPAGRDFITQAPLPFTPHAPFASLVLAPLTRNWAAAAAG